MPTYGDIRNANDLGPIRKSDTLYILLQYVRQIPGNIKVISMVPDNDKQKHYNTSRKKSGGVPAEEIIHIQKDLPKFINRHFRDHPLAGELLYFVEENLGVERSTKGAQLAKILHLLMKQDNIDQGEKWQQSTFGFQIKGKRKAYQELFRRTTTD